MSGGASWAAGLQVLASLVLVVALLAATLWGLKRLQGSRAFGRRDARLQVVESLSLGPRHKLALVRCDGRELLVGLSPTAVNALGGWTAAPGDAKDPA